MRTKGKRALLKIFHRYTVDLRNNIIKRNSYGYHKQVSTDLSSREAIYNILKDLQEQDFGPLGDGVRPNNSYQISHFGK